MHYAFLLILSVVLAVYLVLGGVIFHFLEYENEKTTKSTVINFHEAFLKNYSCVDNETFKKLILSVQDSVQSGTTFSFSDANDSATITTTSGSNWNIASAIFFSTTVVTTIGYGNVSPATYGGQTVVVIYALIGIPLCGIFLAGIGDKLGKRCKFIREKLESCLPDKRKQAIALYITILFIGGLTLFFVIPSAVFMAVEGWTYHEGFYYSIVTLTTIGFGDFVAGQQPAQEHREIYKICLAFWVFFGLAFMALVIDQMSAGVKLVLVKKLERNVDKAKKDKVEDGASGDKEDIEMKKGKIDNNDGQDSEYKLNQGFRNSAEKV